MRQPSEPLLDALLDRRDVQSLSSLDAIAALFTKLGYNTDSRLPQSPANLGITAESIIRSIKHIELLADHDSLFQVYLFQLTSVTVAAAKALANAFRNRTGNFLLILTSHFERIDFVLLERYLPQPTSPSGIAVPRAGIRPRTLSINRREPSAVELRVLRRMTWTEADAFAQYDKLLSAYSIADWSEEYFNNRALFSDYYLLTRLQDLVVWRDDPRRAYLQLRGVYADAPSRFAGKLQRVVRTDLLEPVFGILGFRTELGSQSTPEHTEPDYRLFGVNGEREPLAVALAYPWGRSLDGKDDRRDSDTPDENPGATVVSLLERGDAPWAIVTNGKTWRLYAKGAHSRATNYYEVDLAEVLAQQTAETRDIGEAFRYFWLFFRRQAFEPQLAEDGFARRSFLDRLLAESDDYAKELGERLKERVFEEVFPHLARGFIQDIRSREGSVADLSQPRLDLVFQGTLTLLYRLLFLLYAEARDLLPARELGGYFEASLKKIKEEIAASAGQIVDEAGGNTERAYRHDGYDLYDRLRRLFRAVDRGDTRLNVPIYSGGLFLSAPSDDDDSAEADAARFLDRFKIPDGFLARAVDLLARDVDRKRHNLVFIDFKSLGVRQLGNIYEGLLEFRLRIAPEKMAIVRGKNTEEIVTYREALGTKAKVLTDGRGRSAQERTLAKGAVYLENNKRERKASGSYYTPDHIVQHIVEQSVGPILSEKHASMRSKLREVQRRQRAFRERRDALAKQHLKPEPHEKIALIGRELVPEFFDIKVLDPAMGSGHFLVEAVDYITDKTLDLLNSFPNNPVLAHLSEMRLSILEDLERQGVSIDPGKLTDVNLLKRHVLKRCIYGVDLNPMAVELAKVSLWLDCFTLGAPLSFLDHHLKCGNSLIGVNVEEVREAVEPIVQHRRRARAQVSAKEWKVIESTASQFTLFGGRWAGLMLATNMMRQVGELSDVTSTQLSESRSQFHQASEALTPFKRILDVYTSQWFGNEATVTGGRGTSKENIALAMLKDSRAEPFFHVSDAAAARRAIGELPVEHQQTAHVALDTARDRRFFHWELEFPEVFYGPRQGTSQEIVRLENGGFDALVGNPPYDVLASEELGYDVSIDVAFFKALAVYEPAIRGKNNLYKLFICRGASLMNKHGTFSFIVPMALLGDDQSAGVRKMLLQQTTPLLVDAFPQKDDRNRRVFPEAKLSTTVFVVQEGSADKKFTVRTHPGRWVEKDAGTLTITPSEIITFDPGNAALPSCTQRDWNLAVQILAARGVKRMESVARSFQGEVNETNEGRRGSFSGDGTGPVPLRGANITLYTVRSASQGTELHLDVSRFLQGKGEDSKAHAYRDKRIGFQRKAPQNNFRRLIAAPVDEGKFCFESITYCPEDESFVDLDLLLCLLNSAILEWYFRLGSSNAQVNGYQFDALPVPTIVGDPRREGVIPVSIEQDLANAVDRLGARCTEPGILPGDVAVALAAMSQRIQEIEAKRVLKNRSERSHLAPESQAIQDAIDAILFRCYGLSDDDARYIDQRLREML